MWVNIQLKWKKEDVLEDVLCDETHRKELTLTCLPIKSWAGILTCFLSVLLCEYPLGFDVFYTNELFLLFQLDIYSHAIGGASWRVIWHIEALLLSAIRSLLYLGVRLDLSYIW